MLTQSTDLLVAYTILASSCSDKLRFQMTLKSLTQWRFILVEKNTVTIYIQWFPQNPMRELSDVGNEETFELLRGSDARVNDGATQMCGGGQVVNEIAYTLMLECMHIDGYDHRP